MAKKPKNIPPDLCKKITTLVSKGKTDREIGEILAYTTKHIRYIRSEILHISLYGQKRKCKKCHEFRVNTCFKDDSEDHPGWCIICRRKAGADQYVRKPRPKTFPVKEKTGTFKCLHCDEDFVSEVWGMTDTHFYLCPPCRHRATCIDQVSMFVED